MASTGSERRFTGSIPDIYDELMGPVFFQPYAEDMASRVARLLPHQVLEVAAGTGILTRAIVEQCPSAQVLATDLNQPMLDRAASLLSHPAVTWQQADAMDLPVEDGSCDVVACQFGVMFFPEQRVAFREARRALTQQGHFLFTSWDSVEANPTVAATRDAMHEIFPDDPPTFLERTPHGYHDVDVIRRDLEAAGFTDVQIETLALAGAPRPALDIARALCTGTPLRFEIEARAADRLDLAVDTVARLIAERLGDDDVAAPLSAHVVSARR